MFVINNSSELINAIAKLKNSNDTIAFVPTMGNLHEGHLKLVSLAHENASIVVVSIFVNPLQFNQANDLKNYPRTLERDLELCRKQGVDFVFTPSVDDIYPNGEKSDRCEISELESLSNVLEGAFRPDHFSGVVTVVKKFFELVRPDVAIFGEKDFQQLQVIKQMVAILNLPVKIISSKTIRENDGLAMSSRNSKLSDSDREQAAKIYRVLKSVKEKILLGKEQLDAILRTAISSLTETGFTVDYLVVRACGDLSVDTDTSTQNERVILIAAELGGIRLIDNLRL